MERAVEGLKVGKEDRIIPHPGSNWFQSLYLNSSFPEAGRRLSPWVVLPVPPIYPSSMRSLLLFFGSG